MFSVDGRGHIAGGNVTGQAYVTVSPQGMVEVPVPYPRVETPKRLGVYLIADNYLAHEHAKVRAWPKRHAPFHMHFTPTCASWLNHIERFFGLITADHVRCEVFKIIPELVERLEGDSR